MTVSWAPRAATFIEVKKQASTGIWPTRKLHIRSRTNQSLDIWVFGVVGADALRGISRSVVEPPISVQLVAGFRLFNSHKVKKALTAGSGSGSLLFHGSVVFVFPKNFARASARYECVARAAVCKVWTASPMRFPNRGMPR